MVIMMMRTNSEMCMEQGSHPNSALHSIVVGLHATPTTIQARMLGCEEGPRETSKSVSSHLIGSPATLTTFETSMEVSINGGTQKRIVYKENSHSNG